METPDNFEPGPSAGEDWEHEYADTTAGGAGSNGSIRLPATFLDIPEGIIPLGHDRQVFYYLSRSAQQVFALSADKHTKNNMMAMASVPHYWERTQFLTDKGAVKWDDVTDFLMRSCREVGIFNPDRIRGRGAWLDQGRALLHLGDRILADGTDIGLSVPASPYVYEGAKPLTVVSAPPLSNTEAHCLIKLCGRLRWEKPVYGKLLAGWIALAPICGALAWRPSIWITGGPGSGKSWLRENLMARCLGNIALAVQSKTSEAGIRQSLGSDARPVMFDEAEREDAQAAARMQAVLDLVRQSSSEGGAEIVKGTGNQSGVKRYRIRSMFAFQSINVGIQHQADESRITVLSLREPVRGDQAGEDAFKDLEAAVAERLTPEYSAGLIARSVACIPVIRANAETFAQAIAGGLGTRRMGDQIGTLLAGAYSLHTTGLITLEAAAAFVAGEEWSDNAGIDEDKDEQRLLRTILAYRIRVGVTEMPVSRLLEAAGLPEQREGLPAPELAHRVLSEAGIKWTYRENVPGIYVSTNHPALKSALRGTPWDAGWSRALLRIPGAAPSGHGVRFGTGLNSKATWIPMVTLEPNEEDSR